MRSHAMATSATSSSGHRKRGWYHPFPSKAMMKVARYRLSGTSHRSGTDATFCVRWLVTASSSTDPVAESASHQAKRAFAIGAASVVSPEGAAAGVSHESAAHISAKTTKSHDHALTCSLAGRNGSSANG